MREMAETEIGLRAAVNAISDVIQNRPRPLREFDQIYMKAGDMLQQWLKQDLERQLIALPSRLDGREGHRLHGHRYLTYASMPGFSVAQIVDGNRANASVYSVGGMGDMQRLWPWLALVAILVGCGPPSPAPVSNASPSVGFGSCPSSTRTVTSSPTPGEPQPVTLCVGGLERTYYVLFPASRTGRLPLVLALHGYTQSAGLLESQTGLNDEAAIGGFVLAYPEGIGRSWNVGSCCAEAKRRNIDDVAFIKQVIDQLVSGGRIDPKRVFATGISNGGMMDYRLACDLSDRIAAIASVSGALMLNPCNPPHTVSVLEMHGTDDSQVPIGGGTFEGLGPFPPTMSTMQRWVGIDGCTADPTVTKTDITETTMWTACRNGSSVVLAIVKGGSHTFWLDRVPAQLNVNEYIWNFFKNVPMRT